MYIGDNDEHAVLILTKDRNSETRHFVLDSQASLAAAVRLARAALDEVGITEATKVVPSTAELERDQPA
jgi:hypothetical protein